MARENTRQVVKGKDEPWERTPHGELKWLQHPGIEDLAVRSLIIYEQRIKPGSRSGRQHHPGGLLVYVKKGEGYTILDGVRLNWGPECLLNLPLRPDGIVYQHFNDSDQEVLLVCCEPNLIGPLGVERGSVFEELEPAPDDE